MRHNADNAMNAIERRGRRNTSCSKSKSYEESRCWYHRAGTLMRRILWVSLVASACGQRVAPAQFDAQRSDAADASAEFHNCFSVAQIGGPVDPRDPLDCECFGAQPDVPGLCIHPLDPTAVVFCSFSCGTPGQLCSCTQLQRDGRCATGRCVSATWCSELARRGGLGRPPFPVSCRYPDHTEFVTGRLDTTRGCPPGSEDVLCGEGPGCGRCAGSDRCWGGSEVDSRGTCTGDATPADNRTCGDASRCRSGEACLVVVPAERAMAATPPIGNPGRCLARTRCEAVARALPERYRCALP
jgi:hypothetical protein